MAASKEQLDAALERARRAAAQGVRLAELDMPEPPSNIIPLPPPSRIVAPRPKDTGGGGKAGTAVRDIREARAKHRRLSASLGDMLAGRACIQCGAAIGHRDACPDLRA